MRRRQIWGLLLMQFVLVGGVVGTVAATANMRQAGAQTTQDELVAFWQRETPNSQTARAGSLALGLGQELLAKAQPDECFNGPGQPYTGTVPLCEYGMPKVNQAYVWGLTKLEDALWFGTGPNVHCLVLGTYLGITTTLATDSYICEFGASQTSPPLPPGLGDWRPPELYRYDLEVSSLSHVTPPDALISDTLGIRSAGGLDGVVLLGGPALSEGLNLFAFDATTGSYLGSANVPEYDNIRKWLVVDDVLYAGVRDAASGGGRVLRWVGTPGEPFQFEVVGNLGSEAAELALHEGRLFATTWPNLMANPPESASLYASPPIPAGGLTAAHAAGWERLWHAEDYEPDPVTALVYGGGALHSFDGSLYWGTMHVPFVGAVAHFAVYGPPVSPLQAANAILGSHRAISIFRGRGFNTADPEIELVYGSLLLPAYLPPAGWLIVPNAMGRVPLWGGAGFGDFYNNYTWTMEVHQGQLYVGTMDWSYLLDEGLPLILEFLGIPPGTPIPLPPGEPGADLYRLRSATEPAQAVSMAGVGNPTNYGIRTMIADEALYLGMANPMNLLTDAGDDLPEGGWELLRLAEGQHAYLPLVGR